MKTYKKLTIVIFITFILAGCSGADMFTLTPHQEKVEFDQGREIVFKEDNIAASSINFEDYDGESFIFFVYAYNKSEEKIQINPEKIYMEILDKNFKPVKNNERFYSAVNPEEQIRLINKNIKDRETSHDVTTGLNVLFTFVGVAADLSDDDDENEDGGVIEKVAIFADNQVNEEIDYSNDMEYLHALKEFWKNEVLRKTNLDTDEDVGGSVLIPANNEAKFVKVTIPLGETKHTDLFKQVRIN